MSLDKVAKIIKDRKNRVFVISAHHNLEGDAIGSMLAMQELLVKMKKKAIILPPEEISDLYKFMPGAEKIKYLNSGKKIAYDVAAIVDCTGLDRLGGAKKHIETGKPIINIDHHVSNSYFGTANWVEPKTSCSGEQVYHLFKKLNVPISRKAAVAMYVAILTDTGSFKYSNTSALTHEIAAELIRTGLIKPTAVYRKIYEVAHKHHLVLLSRALDTLETTKDGKIAWIKITRDMMKEHKAGVAGSEDFVNFARTIRGVKISLAFREIGEGKVKVGFRSNEGVDVNKLARAFGGGGHRSASGCLFKGTVAQAEKAVLARAKKLLQE